MITTAQRSAQSGCKVPTALQVLNALAFDTLKFKHPLIKSEWLPKQSFKDSTANSLTKCIIAWVKLNGGFAERVNVSGRLIDKRSVVSNRSGSSNKMIGHKIWIPTSGTKGSADIHCVIRGRAVQVEVKIKNDRQSSYQITYQQNIERSGGLYFIARDFQSFYNWYKLTFE